MAQCHDFHSTLYTICIYYSVVSAHDTIEHDRLKLWLCSNNLINLDLLMVIIHLLIFPYFGKSIQEFTKINKRRTLLNVTCSVCIDCRFSLASMLSCACTISSVTTQLDTKNFCLKCCSKTSMDCKIIVRSQICHLYQKFLK